MLTLDQAKAHLKLDPADTSEDALLGTYVAAALGIFKVTSKRRWPVEGEPELVKVTDPTTEPPTSVFLGYMDPAVLGADEQAVAMQYLLLTVGHFYENRQTVAVGLNVTEVPHTAKMLMNLLREPTL